MYVYTDLEDNDRWCDKTKSFHKDPYIVVFTILFSCKDLYCLIGDDVRQIFI